MKNSLVFAMIALMLASCTNEAEEINDGPGKIILSVSTTSGQTGSVNGRVKQAQSLTFTSGTITIREVVFDGDVVGSESVSRTVEQIATVDYATGDISPELIVEVPAGTYTSVNLGIELQDVGSSPSVMIEGTYINDAEVSIPVRFEFNSGEVFEANAATVQIEPGTDVTGKITFDALDWFSTVSVEDLENATLTQGVMIISSTSNTDIFEIVAERLDVATQAIFE